MTTGSEGNSFLIPNFSSLPDACSFFVISVSLVSCYSIPIIIARENIVRGFYYNLFGLLKEDWEIPFFYCAKRLPLITTLYYFSFAMVLSIWNIFRPVKFLFHCAVTTNLEIKIFMNYVDNLNNIELVIFGYALNMIEDL